MSVATFALDDVRLAVADEVRDSMPRRWHRSTRVLIHGVDVGAARESLARRDATRAALGFDATDVVVCTLANFRANKDHPNLVAAARIVLDRRPEVRFVVAGQGPLQPEIAALVRDAGIEDRFRILGYRDDAIDVLAASDLLAVASVREGLPVAVMEALALGRPVVSTAVGGIPDLVRDGVEGRLVPAGDAKALASALIDVVSDPVERARLAAGAETRAAAVDVATVAGELSAIYLAAVTES